MRLASLALLAFAAACHTPATPRVEKTDAELEAMTGDELLAEVLPDRPRQEYVDRITDQFAKRGAWTPEQAAKIKARQIWVGADIIALMLAWGKPTKVNSTHTASGQVDYMFYGSLLHGGRTVMVENLRVSSWSTH